MPLNLPGPGSYIGLTQPASAPASLSVAQVMTATTVAATASMVRQVGKPLAVTVAVTATIVKQISKTLTTTAVAATASLVCVKQVVKLMTATTIAATASMSRQTAKALTVTVAVSATISRQIAKTLAATVTTIATMIADFISGSGIIITGRFRSGRPAPGSDAGTPGSSNFDPGSPGGGNL